MSFLFRRLLGFIMTLLCVVLVAFTLFQHLTGDPVERLTNTNTRFSNWGEKCAADRDYQNQANLIHSNLPVFYLGLQTSAYPDTLYNIVRKDERAMLQQLIATHGNWQLIQPYFQTLKRLQYLSYHLPEDSLATAVNIFRSNISQLLIQQDETAIRFTLSQIKVQTDTTWVWKSTLGSTPKTLVAQLNEISEHPTQNKHYWPQFTWNGTQNQFHAYISGLLKGNFGISYMTDHANVGDKILKALPWTLTLSILSLMFIFAISIPLGVWAARRKGSGWDRFMMIVTLGIGAVPLFWLGTMAILLLSSSPYGLGIFAGTNISDTYGANDVWWEKILQGAAHLILPIICIVIHGLSMILRQVRSGTLTVLREDYIRTAQAKGLSSKTVLWRHAFRNSLLPIISTFASAFPGLFAGNLITEYVFNIPGMGRLLAESVGNQDTPVVLGILIVGSCWALLGTTLADFMYRWADPRV